MKSRSKIPSLMKERLHLNEVQESERKQTLDEFGQKLVRKEIDELAESDANILAKYPPSMMTARFAHALDHPRDRPWARRKFSRRAIALSVASATLGLMMVLYKKPWHDTDGVRLKGLHPTLLIYKKLGQRSELLESGAFVQSGDLLQLRYIAAGAKYGAIYSIDGRGALTRHDLEGPGLMHLKQDEAVTLDHAYELDDAPTFEIFVLLTGNHKVATDRLAAGIIRAHLSLETAGAIELPKGWQAHIVKLRKRGSL